MTRRAAGTDNPAIVRSVMGVEIIRQPIGSPGNTIIGSRQRTGTERDAPDDW